MNFSVFHTLCRRYTERKLRKLSLIHLLCKNLVKSTLLLSCIIRYFHENSFKRVNFSTLHSVEKRGILSHWKNFREINSVVTLLEKQLLSQNFCQKNVRENFRNFYTVHCVRVLIFPSKRPHSDSEPDS